MSNLDKTIKYSIITLLFASLFLPFVVAHNFYFPFITGKGFSFRILVEIVFFLWLILVIRNRSYLPKKSPLLISISVFVLVIFIANIFGVNREVSLWSNFERMDGFVLLIHIYLYFLVLISVLRTTSLWNKLIATSVIAASVISVYGLFQLFGVLTVNQGGVRLDATFGNATYLAVYLLFNIFFAGYLLYKQRNKTLRYLYGVTILLQLIILYYTATRGAVLGLIGGIMLTSIIMASFSKSKKIKKINIGFLLAVILLSGIFFSIRNVSFVKENPVLGRFASISLNDNTTLSRFIIWNMAWEGFKDRPLLGYGQGNFNTIFDQRYDPRLYNQEQWFDRPHNVVFNWLVAGGLIGFIAYVSIFVLALRLLFSRTSLDVTSKALFTGILAAYVFQNLFVFDNLLSYMLFFIVLGYIHNQSTGGEDDTKASPLINSVVLKNTISSLIVVLIFVTIYFINVPAMRSAVDLAKAVNATRIQSGELVTFNGTAEDHLNLFRQSVSRNTFGDAEIRSQFMRVATLAAASNNVNNDTRTAFVIESVGELEKQIQESPGDARYPYILGSSLANLGQLETGIRFMEQAVAISPQKQSIRLNLPIAYAQLGDVDKALEVAKEGYEINPDDDNSWNLYIELALASGQNEIVDDLINESLVNKPQRVVMFLARLLQANPDNGGLISILISALGTMDEEGRNSAISKIERNFPEVISILQAI